MTAIQQFEEIVTEITIEKDCSLGKMMSSPGLKYKNKVFAFLWKDKMGFKLGKDYDMGKHAIHNWEYLSPFKTKAPLTAWYIVDESYHDLWKDLTLIALKKIKCDLK